MVEWLLVILKKEVTKFWRLILISKYLILTFILLTISFLACEGNKIEGIYSTEGGPYFHFKKNNRFEFGIPNDPNPLNGNFLIENEKIELTANSIMLGSYATTHFKCHLSGDTLFIDKLHISHPRFEILIDKENNYAKTIRDSVIEEFKLDSQEAESELFIYYNLINDKFIKRKGEQE